MKKTVRVLFSLLLCVAVLISAVACTGNTQNVSSTEEIDNDKLLLTIACLSDIHNQHSLIDSATPHLRPAAVTALTAMKEQEEKVDMVLSLGDFSSDSRVPESNVTTLVNELKSHVDALNAKLLMVSGNHDYHAGQGSEHVYNSADYYNYVMKDSVGELTGDDAYYEKYDGEDYLLGFHYVVNGFDFVGMSLSPADMKVNEAHYTYTAGTLNWLESKLASIGKNKTVFLLAHVPAQSSNSLEDNKGMIPETTDRFVSICKNYPNLLHLYGHDHGRDTAYIYEDTIERVTVYDSNGTVIVGGRSQNRISSLSDQIVWKFTLKNGRYLIQNAENGEYLSVDSNLSPLNTQHYWLLSGTAGAFNLKSMSAGKYVYYSTNSNSFSVNPSATSLSFFKKTPVDGGYEFIFADKVEDGGEYVIMSTEHNRALLNELSISNSERMAAVDVGVTAAENNSYKLFYTGDGLTGKEPQIGFTSTFVGSMRYYSNSFDGMIGDGNPKLIQALMIYVYSDRIVLQMKNYGEKNGGSEVLAPYAVPRENAQTPVTSQAVAIDPRAIDIFTNRKEIINL